MEKTERPKSWPERKKEIKHKRLTPFIYVEWLCEWLSYLFGRWAFLDILGHVGRLTILVAVISYIWGIEGRREERHYQAWQVINDAQGKPGNLGRIKALQDLNDDRVYLTSVDISKAFLPDVDLQNAKLWDANLSMARLDYANLSGADLWGANLSKAEFYIANLSGAHIKHANLSGVDLRGANLSGADLDKVGGWKKIQNITLTNIYGIKNPPNGFIQWAKDKGAVEIESYKEWQDLLKKKGYKRKMR